jgi:hypothetical protein
MRAEGLYWSGSSVSTSNNGYSVCCGLVCGRNDADCMQLANSYICRGLRSPVVVGQSEMGSTACTTTLHLKFLLQPLLKQKSFRAPFLEPCWRSSAPDRRSCVLFVVAHLWRPISICSCDLPRPRRERVHHFARHSRAIGCAGSDRVVVLFGRPQRPFASHVNFSRAMAAVSAAAALR